jgi:hypothetical protein
VSDKDDKPASQPQEALSPELLAALELAVDRLRRRRKINLIGYFSAITVIVVGMVFGLWYMGTGQPGEFRGWVMLLPFAAAGALLWGFGKLSRKV